MCGIVGIVSCSPVNQQLYDALTVLQHRGQDAAGIMTAQEGELFLRKDNGLVRDVFQQQHMLRLKGNMGIGHVRYPTAGCDSSARSAAVLRQLALRHLPGAQRQPHQRRRAVRGARPRGPAPPQHELRLRSAAQRVRARAAALRHAARLGGRHLRGRERRVSALPRRLCGGRDDPRPRRARLPRPARHPAAGARHARRPARPRVHARLRERGARHARLRAAARRRAGRGRVHRRAGPAARAAVRRARRGTRPASSSTSTSRVPTRSSTTSRCTRRACAWARCSRRRSGACGRTTTSTS